MEVTIQGLNAGDVPVVLAGKGREGVSNYRLNGQRLVQVVGGFRKEAIEAFDRKNRQNEITFDVARTFDTLDEAEVFVLEHPDKIPGRGTIVFTARNGGRVVKRKITGVIQLAALSFSGVTVFTSYQIIGGKISIAN